MLNMIMSGVVTEIVTSEWHGQGSLQGWLHGLALLQSLRHVLCLPACQWAVALAGALLTDMAAVAVVPAAFHCSQELCRMAVQSPLYAFACTSGLRTQEKTMAMRLFTITAFTRHISCSLKE